MSVLLGVASSVAILAVLLLDLAGFSHYYLEIFQSSS